MHPARDAESASWPACKYCILALRQKLPAGLKEKSASWRAGKNCIKAPLQAKIARLENAEIARLVSAKFARDSIDYLRDYS